MRAMLITILASLELTYQLRALKETQMKAIRVGQPVRIHIDAFPDDEIKGEVESRAPGTGAQFALLPPNNATGNFTKIVRRVPVKITFPPGADLSQLRPGLSTVIKVKVL